jgi:hypothetical protein
MSERDWSVDEITSHIVTAETAEEAEAKLREWLDEGMENSGVEGVTYGVEYTIEVADSHFSRGVMYALEYLADIYEDIEETNLWKQHFDE